MSGVTGAVVVGVAAAATVASTEIQANAAEDAANSQLDAQGRAIAAQGDYASMAAAEYRRQYDTARSDLEPFRQAQLGALKQSQGLTDINNPYYQEQRDVNTTAIQRQLAAQGLLRSKKQSDLLTNLELGLNQQRTQQVNSLSQIGAVQQGANLALGYGSQIGQLYSQTGNQLGSSLSQIGQINGQAAIARGQAASGLVTGLANVGQSAAGNYLGYQQRQEQNAQLSQLLNPRSDNPYGYGVPLSQQVGGYQIPAYQSVYR